MDRFINKIVQGDCLEVMQELGDDSIDMVLTSPPYDNLREYKEYVFKFEDIAQQLFRIIKIGGVVVWVVGDQTINGSETGTSFEQALYFKAIGFNLHDTMIYMKGAFPFPSINRYYSCFEYMFIFCKGKLKTFNPIQDKLNSQYGNKNTGTNRQKDGTIKPQSSEKYIKKYGVRNNVWLYQIGKNKSTQDNIAYEHPAIFPEKLAHDHIISWSNKGDIILDPMCGSGTTCKMAIKTNRRYIGIEISQNYVDIARKRVENELKQGDLFRADYGQ